MTHSLKTLDLTNQSSDKYHENYKRTNIFSHLELGAPCYEWHFGGLLQ